MTAMAESNSDSVGVARRVSGTHHTATTTTITNIRSSISGQQMQSISNSSVSHAGDGIFRTASGRSTYYPDGHAPRPTSHGSQCAHEEHQPTPSFNQRGSYGLIPARYSQSHAQQVQQIEEREAPLEAVEKLESSSSSSSSTRHGSSGQQTKTAQESDAHHGARLERRNTRAELDDEGRRELQRIFTTQSQKMTQQISIAQPGDATVDPSNEAFDLSRFLRMFRKSQHGLYNSRPY
jgi:ATP-binding cassette subfamily G (WHITE) protein 2 (PDR)